MKVRTWIGSVLSIILLSASLYGQSRDSLLKSIASSPEWSPSGESKQYDEKNLSSLAGKTAPTIERYGLNGVTVQDWKNASGRVHLILYEMSDTAAAYGFFTLQRDFGQSSAAAVPLGTEGFRNSNRTFFWQSKYVVEMEGAPESTNTLGRLISSNITGRSRKPPVSEHLPSNNLVEGSEKYIVDAAGINPNLELNPSAIGFDDDVEVATGAYRINGKTASLVLLLYPTQQLAKKHFDEMSAASPNDAAFRKRVGPLIALVRRSDDPEAAKTILDSIGYESKITWDQRHPDLTLSDIILTIFTFIGIALLFTVVAGISFGGLRIFVKSKYPNRVFDRQQDLEIIQLKLAQELIRKELGQ